MGKREDHRVGDPAEAAGALKRTRREAPMEARAMGQWNVTIKGTGSHHNAAFVGATFSYETFYQAVRRNWRFGQKRAVHAHVALAPTELQVWEVLASKRAGHDEMRAQMSAAMRRRQGRASDVERYRATRAMEIPSWLRPEVRS